MNHVVTMFPEDPTFSCHCLLFAVSIFNKSIKISMIVCISYCAFCLLCFYLYFYYFCMLLFVLLLSPSQIT